MREQRPGRKDGRKSGSLLEADPLANGRRLGGLRFLPCFGGRLRSILLHRAPFSFVANSCFTLAAMASVSTL